VGRIPAAAARYVPSARHLDVESHTDAAQRVTMSNITDDPTVSRKRADSHQPASTPPQARQTINSSHAEYRQSPTTSTHSISSSNPDGPRSYSRTDYEYAGTTLLPQLSPMSPYSEVRKLSGNWNAPTHVELERTRQHRKSLSSVEKLRNRVKGWVRA
jgi:hypothetical protein